MALTKKDEAYIEDLKTRLALKFTPKVEPDVEIPESGLRNGYSHNVHSARVEKSCSSPVSHCWGHWDETRSQNPIRQFSSRLLALRAMRYEMEMEFARELRKVDKMIEAEEKENGTN